MLDFHLFVRTLNSHGVDPSSSTMLRLYNDLAALESGDVITDASPYDLMLLRSQLTSASVHDQLVEVALNSDTIPKMLESGQKIQAVKELRVETGCGLKEAKDAIEDRRVIIFYIPTTP